MGQEPPGTAGPNDIADGVDDLPSVSCRATAELGRGDERGKPCPFGIGEITGLGGTRRWGHGRLRGGVADRASPTGCSGETSRVLEWHVPSSPDEFVGHGSVPTACTARQWVHADGPQAARPGLADPQKGWRSDGRLVAGDGDHRPSATAGGSVQPLHYSHQRSWLPLPGASQHQQQPRSPGAASQDRSRLSITLLTPDPQARPFSDTLEFATTRIMTVRWGALRAGEQTDSDYRNTRSTRPDEESLRMELLSELAM